LPSEPNKRKKEIQILQDNYPCDGQLSPNSVKHPKPNLSSDSTSMDESERDYPHFAEVLYAVPEESDSSDDDQNQGYVINESWVETEEPWESHNTGQTAIKDPLVISLSSGWKNKSHAHQLVNNQFARFFDDITTAPEAQLVPKQILDKHNFHFLQKVFLEELSKRPTHQEMQNNFERFTVLKHQQYPSFLDLSWANVKERDAFKQPMYLIEMLRKQIDIDSESINLSFGTLLLVLRIISWIDLRLTSTEKKFPSNDLEVMKFLKSNKFMKFLMQVAKSDIHLELKLGNYSIKELKEREPAEQFAKIICHLISIPNKPINFFHYLALLNGCGLSQDRTQLNTPYCSARVTRFSEFLKSHPLYGDFRTFISQLEIESLPPEKILMISYILGQLAHDSISKSDPDKYEHENEYYKIIKFRHSLIHGNSFYCSDLFIANGIFMQTKIVLKDIATRTTHPGFFDSQGTKGENLGNVGVVVASASP